MSPVPAKVRLVSTDFDGTIHEDFVRPGIPAALQRKLSALQQSGVTWVINTGRDMVSLMQSLEQTDIRVRPDYVVLVEREIFRRVGPSQFVPVEPWNTGCTQAHAGLFRILESAIIFQSITSLLTYPVLICILTRPIIFRPSEPCLTGI